MPKEIDLLQYNSLTDREKAELGSYLANTKWKLFEKKMPIQKDPFVFSQHLIQGRNIKHPENKLFYVVSPNVVIGKGGENKIRDIVASLEVDSAGKIIYEPYVQHKVFRVSNTQEKELKRDEEHRYKHEETLKIYEDSKPFKHLNWEEPIASIKDKEGLGVFTKSYSIMEKIPGNPFNTKEILDQGMTLQAMIHNVILPLLEAYQTQVENTGFVHRDIKPANVLLNSNGQSNPCEVNFIDFDYAIKAGEKDSGKGSVGYMPNECFIDVGPATSKRDIFALGMMMVAAINPDLEITRYLCNAMGFDNDPLNALKFQIANPVDIATLIMNTNKINENNNGFFESLADKNDIPEDIQKEIIKLIDKSIAVKPTDRPSVTDLIENFKAIENKLDVKVQNKEEEVRANRP